MLLEEGLAEGGVAEGFGAARAEGGECSGDVAEGCGAEGIVAPEPGAEEAGVEAVAGTDGVDGFDENGANPVSLDAVFGALLDEGSAGSALDDDEGDSGSESVEGLVEGGLAGYLLEFVFIGKEDVYLVEEGRQDAAPVTGRVVVCVEGYRDVGLFEGGEELRKVGMKGGLEEERGEMEVACRGEIGDVEIGNGHLCHDTGVRKDVALAAMGKKEGDAGAGAGPARDVCDIKSGFSQASDGDFPHLVGSNLRGESDACAEEREVVGEYGGGAAEGEIEGGPEEFALGGHGGRETIEDEIEIGFPGDGDVERLGGRDGVRGNHGKPSYCFVAYEEV